MRENVVNFDTGGSTAAPGKVGSTIPPSAWLEAESVSRLTSFACSDRSFILLNGYYVDESAFRR